MKKKIILLGVLMAVLSGLAAFFYFAGTALSDAQQETVDLLGNPDQFVITYLPRGTDDNPEMVRSEVWYYVGMGKQVSFLGGKLVTVEPYQPEGEMVPTRFVPWEIDVRTDFEEMKDVLGTEAIMSIHDLPIYSGEEVQTYLTPGAIFIIEQGYLTYFQTVVEGEPPVFPTELPTPTVTPVTSLAAPQRIVNRAYGFSIQLPAGWFLGADDIVVSSYDTGFLEKNLPLPEKRVKCDFVLPFDEVEMEEQNLVKQTDGMKITRWQITGFEGDGPGFGAGVVYAIESSGQAELWLVCFMADEPYKSELETSLQTFVYEEQP